jgi:hypothetical protein
LSLASEAADREKKGERVREKKGEREGEREKGGGRRR